MFLFFEHANIRNVLTIQIKISLDMEYRLIIESLELFSTSSSYAVH
jgi:hypothetical protein